MLTLVFIRRYDSCISTIMELSPQIQGSQMVASPSGQYLALVTEGRLRICTAHLPERRSDVNIRLPAKEINTVKWNEASNCVLVGSAQLIEVIDLDDASHRIRLDNGGAGFGRFSSADFVGTHHLLVIWEFGKSKLWNLAIGKGAELCDLKMTSDGERWQIRPGVGTAARGTLAMLSRSGAEDMLNLYLPALQRQLASVKLPTMDAQSISWSPDGRWITLLDTPTASPNVHFYTPDGRHFRSYPPANESIDYALGTKAVVWSGDSQTVALTKYDGQIVLLNPRTFSPLAVLEHATTIDQRSLPPEDQASVWQETVSASGERSYTISPQPVIPPLSKPRPTSEPCLVGVAEAKFSCDGTYLATRDERMLNTAWIWNVASLTAHAVIIQHHNIRRMHWHPTRLDTLMLDCGEGIAYLFHASSSQPPTALHTSAPASASMSWLYSEVDPQPILKAATKSSFRLIYPEGRPEGLDRRQSQAIAAAEADDSFEEGASEDSLFDVLSGRKPLPPKTEQSYTERVDFEVETDEEDETQRLDDTFREKKSRRPMPVDPFDDSEIF